MRRTDDLSTPTENHPYLGNMTREEFLEGMDVAQGLLSRRPRTRARSAEDLVAMGPRAVRLAARTIEEVAADVWATDDDIDRQGEAAAAVVRRVGRAAAPVLDELATDGVVDVCVNDWAQELLFEVLGLEGDARRGACHHGAKMREERGGRDVWVCLHCDAVFGEGEDPTKEPVEAPTGPCRPSK